MGSCKLTSCVEDPAQIRAYIPLHSSKSKAAGAQDVSLSVASRNSATSGFARKLLPLYFIIYNPCGGQSSGWRQARCRIKLFLVIQILVNCTPYAVAKHASTFLNKNASGTQRYNVEFSLEPNEICFTILLCIFLNRVYVQTAIAESLICLTLQAIELKLNFSRLRALESLYLIRDIACDEGN